MAWLMLREGVPMQPAAATQAKRLRRAIDGGLPAFRA
jgi:hypothetical protein